MAEAEPRSQGTHISQQQRLMLVEFMERHPCLIKGSSVLSPEITKAGKAQLWRELAEALNAEGPAEKTTEQWRNYWKKEVYESRHDAAVVAAEHRGTGGGRLSGLRGRVLALVGRSSAVGVCDGFFEEDSGPSSSSAQPQAGDTSSIQPASPPVDVHPVTGSPRPGGQATPCRRPQSEHATVADQPVAGGLSRAGHQERHTPVCRPSAEEFLPGIAAGYEKSLELAAEIKSELQQLKDAISEVATSSRQLVETAVGQSAALQRLAAAAEAQAECQARQAAALEHEAAIAEQQLSNQAASQARLAASAEWQVIVSQLILQQLQRLAAIASGDAVPGGQRL